MEIQNYGWNNTEFVVGIGKTRIIYHGWKNFEMDLDYIENNFDCRLSISNRKYPVFHTEKEAERYMEYLRLLIEPYLIMEKLLGG